MFANQQSNYKDSFTFAWEFLNWSDRPLIQEAYARYHEGEMDIDGFLEIIFGSIESVKEYKVLVSTVKNLNGKILETNLSREQKAPVVKNGLAALDPELLPPGFSLGGANYFERFKKAMGGHASPEKLNNYFAAQCLVDDVAAYHISTNTKTAAKQDPVFLVMGSFHTDYFDGAFARLLERDPMVTRKLVKIVPASEFSNLTEFQNVVWGSVYGDIADYVLVTP